MCTSPGCAGVLHDNTLDWDSKLPEEELEAAIDHADKAVCHNGQGGRGVNQSCTTDRISPKAMMAPTPHVHAGCTLDPLILSDSPCPPPLSHWH